MNFLRVKENSLPRIARTYTVEVSAVPCCELPDMGLRGWFYEISVGSLAGGMGSRMLGGGG
jgi:hypothetical protein